MDFDMRDGDPDFDIEHNEELVCELCKINSYYEDDFFRYEDYKCICFECLIKKLEIEKVKE